MRHSDDYEKYIFFKNFILVTMSSPQVGSLSGQGGRGDEGRPGTPHQAGGTRSPQHPLDQKMTKLNISYTNKPNNETHINKYFFFIVFFHRFFFRQNFQKMKKKLSSTKNFGKLTLLRCHFLKISVVTDNAKK